MTDYNTTNQAKNAIKNRDKQIRRLEKKVLELESEIEAWSELADCYLKQQNKLDAILEGFRSSHKCKLCKVCMIGPAECRESDGIWIVYWCLECNGSIWKEKE